jgi:hypothetical protein
MDQSERSMEMRRASMPHLKLDYMSQEGRQQLADLDTAVQEETPESRKI